jgi:hypothetical protein
MQTKAIMFAGLCLLSMIIFLCFNDSSTLTSCNLTIKCVIAICFEMGENAGEMLEKWLDLLSSMRKCR